MARELPAKVKLGVLDGLSKTLDKVKGKFPELSRAVARTNTAFTVLDKSTEGYRKSLEKVGKSFVSVGKAASIGITAPVLAASGFAVKKFMDIEDALTEIKGSANLSSDELKVFGDRIAQVSKRVAAPQEELLKLAGVAGDVGVRGVDNLEKFAVSLEQLHKITGITGEDAAESIFKMLQLTGEGAGNIDRFGSSLAAVGDKYGVSAKKIIGSTFEITREIAKFGVSSSQAVALAAAVEPLGFNAKQASGAVGDAFRAIDVSLREGGQKLAGLQAITGMTGAELKKQFAEDSTVVFRKFLDGLNKIKEKGGPTAKALSFFGASGEKTQIILEALAKDTGKLSEMMKFAKEEYSANTALTEKYNEATATFSSKLKLLQNHIVILAQKVGAVLVPVLSVFVGIMISFLNFLDAHPILAGMIGSFIGLAAVIGPVLLALGYFVGTLLPQLITGFQIFTAVLAGFKAFLLPIGAFLGGLSLPMLAIGAAIVALIAIIWVFRDAIWSGIVWAWDAATGAVGKFIDKTSEAISALKEFLGFGGQKIEVGAGVQALSGGGLLPQGAALGGLETQASMNPEFQVQTNNARVDINVRAPQSTSVVSESQGGFLSINRGLVGAF